jgi:CheY-like chemotaxis protein
MSETPGFTELEEALHDALAHLHDHDYEFGEILYVACRCDPANGPGPVQSAIIREIEGLRAQPGVPPGAYGRRAFDVLQHRFVLSLTLAETADLLHLSVRQLTRVQRDAVHALAMALWERRRSPEVSDWRSQVRRELAALEMTESEAVAEVGEAIDYVLRLQAELPAEGAARAQKGDIQPGLAAAIHPAALRQMLITALRRLSQHTLSDPITIFARSQDGNARIALVGALAPGYRPDEVELTRNILLPETASISVAVDGDRVFMWIDLPTERRQTVLVVDDNPDAAVLYRRATEGTHYRIVHVERGQEVFPAVEGLRPDAIVLDVMLPDVDGWRLLMHLHESPATSATPIIVCSVVREESLALSLGAALYLPKPVRPGEFRQALAEVLSRA